MLTDGDWLVIYKLGGASPPPELRLLEFTHDMTSNKLHKVEMKFENRDSRLARPELAKYLFIGNTVKFKYGYIGDLSPVHEFVIKGHKGYDTLIVEAYPEVPGLEQRRRRKFAKSKRSDVAKLMAQEMGLKFNKNTVTDTDCKEKSFNQGEKSNWKWLEQNAKKLHFEFGVEDGWLFFRKRPYDKKPDYGFRWRGGSIVGDILKFKPKKNVFQIPAALESIFLDAGTGKQQLTDKQGNDNVNRPLAGHGTSLISAGIGAVGGVNAAVKGTAGKPILKMDAVTLKTTVLPDGQEKIIATRVPSKQKRTKRRKKDDGPKCKTEDLFKRAEDMILEADVELMGQPKLRDKQMIALDGLDKAYDGLYYILGCKHKLGISVGYKTILKVETNSAGTGSGPQSQKATAGKANKDKSKIQLGAARQGRRRILGGIVTEVPETPASVKRYTQGRQSGPESVG